MVQCVDPPPCAPLFVASLAVAALLAIKATLGGQPAPPRAPAHPRPGQLAAHLPRPLQSRDGVGGGHLRGVQSRCAVSAGTMHSPNHYSGSTVLKCREKGIRTKYCEKICRRY